MAKISVKPVMLGTQQRMSFAKIDEAIGVPNLLDVQKKSYRWFIEEGLREVLVDVSPIVDYSGNLLIDFVDYTVEKTPKYSIEECKERDVNYAAPLRVKVRLKNETLAPKFEAFIGAGAHVAPGDEFQIDISSEDTEYKEYVVNLAEIKSQSYIDGRTTVGSIRLDGLSISETELAESGSAILYIDYFGFFKTVEDAQNWNPAHVVPATAE